MKLRGTNASFQLFDAEQTEIVDYLDQISDKSGEKYEHAVQHLKILQEVKESEADIMRKLDTAEAELMQKDTELAQRDSELEIRVTELELKDRELQLKERELQQKAVETVEKQKTDRFATLGNVAKGLGLGALLVVGTAMIQKGEDTGEKVLDSNQRGRIKFLGQSLIKV